MRQLQIAIDRMEGDATHGWCNGANEMNGSETMNVCYFWKSTKSKQFSHEIGMKVINKNTYKYIHKHDWVAWMVGEKEKNKQRSDLISDIHSLLNDSFNLWLALFYFENLYAFQPPDVFS